MPLHAQYELEKPLWCVLSTSWHSYQLFHDECKIRAVIVRWDEIQNSQWGKETRGYRRPRSFESLGVKWVSWVLQHLTPRKKTKKKKRWRRNETAHSHQWFNLAFLSATEKTLQLVAISTSLKFKSHVKKHVWSSEITSSVVALFSCAYC